MKKICSLSAAGTVALLASFFASHARADGQNSSTTPPGACQDLVIVMKDDSGDVANPKKMTAFLDCHEPAGNLPSGTTMNFFIFDQGRLCHGYRVCGNLSGWEGTFVLGGTYYFDRNFNDAFDVASNCSYGESSCSGYGYPFGGWGLGGYPYGHRGGSNVHMDFITKFSNIDRHCGALHDYQCLELPTPPSGRMK
ncbi:hypothetical protein EBU99_07210 [bacterium]|nr:hypothetical protein [bacterium]